MTYFFDVPVYRLSQEKYNRERDAYIAGALATDEFSSLDHKSDRHVNQQSHLWSLYGGCWQFNEIIGYIRLHFMGAQVRGEYFGVNKKRIVKSRTKTFEYQTWKLVPEIEISRPITSAGILAAVCEYLENCKAKLPHRHIDTELFTVIAEHVNWRDLYLSQGDP